MPEVRPTRTPKWAVGMRKHFPGIYSDSTGTIHVCTREICESIGMPATEANCDEAERAAIDALRLDHKINNSIQVEHTDDSDAI